MHSFSIYNPVNLYFGLGQVARAGELAGAIGRKALIVTGCSSARKAGTLQKVVSSLGERKISSILFEEVVSNSLSSIVDEGTKLAKAENCDCIVGLGGGSAIDTAKAIALCAVNPGHITDYQPGGASANLQPNRSLPVVAIPTTAGTGSEMNRYFVITNEKVNEKAELGFECSYPAVAIVDPEVMASMPVNVTADTGVGVLFHALEAYVSAGAQPFSDIMAKEAMALVVENLAAVLQDGGDMRGRAKMAWASTLAGWSADIAGTSALHAAGYSISGHTGAPYGQSLAALGVAYMEQNCRNRPARFAVVARLLGVREDLPEEELAALSPQALQDFLKKAGRDIPVQRRCGSCTTTPVPRDPGGSRKTIQGLSL